jgi:hypothetical protein
MNQREKYEDAKLSASEDSDAELINLKIQYEKGAKDALSITQLAKENAELLWEKERLLWEKERDVLLWYKERDVTKLAALSANNGSDTELMNLKAQYEKQAKIAADTSQLLWEKVGDVNKRAWKSACEASDIELMNQREKHEKEAINTMLLWEKERVLWKKERDDLKEKARSES